MQTVIEVANPTRIAASTLVRSGAGGLMGIFVAQAAAGTITIYDSLTAVAPILVNTFGVAAGVFYPLPFLFTTGLFVAIGGAVDCTVGWGPVTA